MSFSNALENALLKHVFRDTDFTSSLTFEVGLSTANPGETGSGIAEPANSYARVTVNNDTDEWLVSGSASSNINDVVFPTASGSWGTITHAFLWDVDNAVMLAYGQLTVSKPVTTGDIFKFLGGALVISLD